MKKKTGKQEEKQEEKPDNSTMFFVYSIIALVVIIILIVSIRYFYRPQEELQQYSYNNFLFTNITGMWITEIQKAGTNKLYRVPLHFGPLELEDIPVNGSVNLFKNYSEIYITFDPEKEPLSFIALSASEISINLAQTLNITPVAACVNNTTPACAERPVITCRNPGKPAVFLNYANKTQIYVKNNCIFVEGMGKEIVRATDRLLLTWFSVMS